MSDSFTVAEARDDLVAKIGLANYAAATAQQASDIAHALNYALEILHTAGDDFFLRQQLTVAVGAGVASVTLADGVQSVLGPVRLPGGMPLRALASRGQLDAFGPLYLGQSSYSVANNLPMAYWIESVANIPNQSAAGTSDNAGSINIYLVPPPNFLTSIVVEGVEQIVRLAVADMSDSGSPAPSAKLLPVPNRYAEALFLPIARHAMVLSNSFSRASMIPLIEADYKAAMAVLVKAGGFPPAVQPSPPNREVAA